MQILGVRIDNFNLKQVLEKIEGFLADGQQHFIVLPYAEFLVKAQEDEAFKKKLNQADLCLAEGFGVILGSYFLGQPIQGRIIGVELVEAIVKKFGLNHHIFFFGAKEGVAREAAAKLERKFNGVKFIETLNGFISDNEAIIKINEAKPEILLVGLGMPKQEKWLAENLLKIPSVKVAAGVGGAFDFISGRVRRAPRIFQKLGLEWLWRLMIQPGRIKRVFRSIVVFSWLVIKQKFVWSNSCE